MLSEQALTTIEALQSELQIPAEDSSQNKMLARWINAASDAIRAYCARDFARERRSDLLIGPGRRALLLSLYPLLDIHEVVVDGRGIFAREYQEDQSKGILWHRYGGWPRTEIPCIEVDYTGGYVTPAQAEADEDIERTLPYDIEEACIVTAATWASQQGTPRDAVMMQVEQMRVQFGGRDGQSAAQSLLPTSVQMLLSAHRRWL